MNAIKKIRSERKISLEKLGNLIGTSGQQVHRLETGERPLTEAWAKKLSSALNVSPAAIFGYEEAVDVRPFSVNQIIEVDGHAGAGLAIGALSTEMAYDGSGNASEVDGTRGLWDFPAEYISQLHVTPKTTRIIEVKGDSMEPTLRSGDRIMIDQDDRCPTPPGIFALWDGFGVVVKRIEHIDGSEPPRLIVSSENQRHSTYERTADEVNIIGRVVWVGRKL